MRGDVVTDCDKCVHTILCVCMYVHHVCICVQLPAAVECESLI